MLLQFLRSLLHVAFGCLRTVSVAWLTVCGGRPGPRGCESVS